MSDLSSSEKNGKDGLQANSQPGVSLRESFRKSDTFPRIRSCRSGLPWARISITCVRSIRPGTDRSKARSSRSFSFRLTGKSVTFRMACG